MCLGQETQKKKEKNKKEKKQMPCVNVFAIARHPVQLYLVKTRVDVAHLSASAVHDVLETLKTDDKTIGALMGLTSHSAFTDVLAQRLMIVGGVKHTAHALMYMPDKHTMADSLPNIAYSKFPGSDMIVDRANMTFTEPVIRHILTYHSRLPELLTAAMVSTGVYAIYKSRGIIANRNVISATRKVVNNR
jgi:hypothetical protein